MVPYHALHLLHLIKKHDRLAISRVVSGLMKGAPKSPLAQCLVIRYVASIWVIRVDSFLAQYFVIRFVASIRVKRVVSPLTQCLVIRYVASIWVKRVVSP